MSWLDATELRIGLGCMRLPADEALAFETIAAAGTAGITAFDTARAYGPDGSKPGHNERLVAGALRAAGLEHRARIITKGGMTRPAAWVPDGRAKAIAADCEASLAALDGLPIDLYLIHAPDPRTPWSTSVRALARLAEQGLVRRVGLANVTRAELDEAVALAPIAAVQVGLSLRDDHAIRGGVLARCRELGLAVIAHSPLGGPARAGRLGRRPELAEVAERHGARAQEVALAWLLGLGPNVMAIPGARRPETARSAAQAAALELDDADRSALAVAFGVATPVAPVALVKAAKPAACTASAPRADGEPEVVIVMGIPGAGKSRHAADYVDRGYARLNRDERGGSLRTLATELDGRLAAGARRVVLDNTYLTRAARSHVIEAARRYSADVRCLWLDTPLAQAQVNLVDRLLERFGSLPAPEQIRAAARREPWLMLPTSQMRALRELEPPELDEGFASVERVPFSRSPAVEGRGGVFVGAAATGRPDIAEALLQADPSAPHLVFDWASGDGGGALDAAGARVTAAVTGPVEVAACAHGGGPPSCWCRPPLPGLPLAFARAHGLDPARSIVIGCSPAHRTLAGTLGALFIAV